MIFQGDELMFTTNVEIGKEDLAELTFEVRDCNLKCVNSRSLL
jgi:hypothetical protein